MSLEIEVIPDVWYFMKGGQLMALKKMMLTINGAERMVVCDTNDSLADVIRGLGLTGTKVGCRIGVCGICSVLLDGKLIRSCTKKMKTVKDHSEILTIEGIGTPNHMHPLQKAWIKYGGVQCGFCSPGFIVSSYALLKENPDPTREEVREWFRKNHNACRCTGYKPIVDSVMAAAKVMRGEMDESELGYKMPEDGHVYGTDYPRPSGVAKVTGTQVYGDDLAMKIPGILHSAVVMPGPGIDRANIKSVDISEAEAMPGVVKVVTYKDVKGTNRVPFPMGSPRAHADGADRPIFVEDKILYCGDVIALVVAATRKQAREAAKKVKYDLEILPPYNTVLESVVDDADQITPEHPNTYGEFPLIKGEDTRDVIEKSAYVVEASMSSQKEPHLVLEPDCVQAYVDDDGVLTVHGKSHNIYAIKFMISQGVGLPPDKIRVVMNTSGGSFGYACSGEIFAIVGAAALAVGQPVSLTLSYEEHHHFTGKRFSGYTNAKLACDENGKLTAFECDNLFDGGAYTEYAFSAIEGAARFTGITYTIPNIRMLSKIGTSNISLTAAYRAATAPPCFTIFETMMDKLAEKAGIDPFEFRYRNVYREGDLTNNGHTVSVYPMAGLYDLMRPYYYEAVERAKKESTPEKKRGVGISNSVYNTEGSPNHSEIELELNPDGSVTNYNTAEDMGQGTDAHTVMHTYEALRPLGIPIEKIKFEMNDTGLCPNTGVAAGSRTHYATGDATYDAAQKLMNAMRKEDGTYRTYDEMVAEGIPTRYKGIHDTTSFTGPISPDTGMGSPSPEYMWGTFLSEVEVDVATGKTKVLSMRAFVDVGNIGNRLSFEGQGYSGMMHSIGYALREDYSDPTKNTNLVNSGFTFIDDMPDGDNLTINYTVSPRPSSPQGSSGCSEVFQAGPHMAVINAIYNATGARITELPATPEKVKAEMEAVANGTTTMPEKYYLGPDMYEVLDDMIAHPVAAPAPKEEAPAAPSLEDDLKM